MIVFTDIVEYRIQLNLIKNETLMAVRIWKYLKKGFYIFQTYQYLF